MNTLNELRRTLHTKCKDLDIHDACLSDGNVAAQIAIIGEAPGEREVYNKLPLVGGSGQLLWTMLRQYKISRRDVYITNVCKRQLLPTSGNKAQLPRSELNHWQALLRWELQQLPNLKYILCLGNLAMETLIGEHGITKWRGTVRRASIDTFTVNSVEGTASRKEVPVTVLVTFNPAACMRQPEHEPVFGMDLYRFNQVVTGKWKEHVVEAIINPTPKEAVHFIDQLRFKSLPIAYDIETICGQTACVGLANSVDKGMCINFRDEGTNRWSIKDEQWVRDALQRLFNDELVQLVAQNGMFDMTWLWFKDRIRVHRNWFDTMLAHHTLYPTQPHNLGFLTSVYTDMVYYKDEGKNWREGGDVDQFWRYNVKDCCATLGAQQGMLRELKEEGMCDFFFGHVMKLQPHLARMTVGGVKVDQPLKEQITVDLRHEVSQLEQQFRNEAKLATGDDSVDVNPNSPQQLKRLFFDSLKLIGRGVSTNAENRERMMAHPKTSARAKQMLVTLDRYKRDHKFLTTYAEVKCDPDGRMRCEYKQTGVQSAPGRLSSAATMWGSGTNLQNQPQRAYPMFVADDGYVFVYFDLSQAEARVVAWKAQIEVWIEQFEKARIDRSYDCHRALASDMFHIPYGEVPTYDRDESGTPSIRYIAKRCRHGLNYRMGPARLATVTGLPLLQAMEAYEIYHRATPELRQWWDTTISEFRREGVLVSAFGRRLIRLGRVDPEAEDSIVAFYPQSTIGDKVSQVIYQSEEDDLWPDDARIALNVHDALIGLVPEAKVTTCLTIMKHYAEQPLMIDGNELIIPAECKVSVPDEHGVHRWSNMKSIDI